MAMFLNHLKRRAIETAEWRGHQLGKFKSGVKKPHKQTATASCTKCGFEVTINTSPDPNEISMGGRAMGLNCKEQGKCTSSTLW